MAGETSTRQAKIQLVLDITQPLRQMDSIQEKLNKISIERLTSSGANSFSALIDKLKNANKDMSTETEKFQSTAKKLAEAKKELDKAFQSYTSSGSGSDRSALDTAKKNYASAQLDFDNFKAIQDSSSLTKSQARANKNKEAEIKQYQQLMQAELQKKKALAAQAQQSYAKEMEATNAALTYQNSTKSTAGQSTTSAATLFSYQKSMTAIEQQAQGLYKAIQSTTDVVKKREMTAELDSLQGKFAALNKESVEFRKTFGVQASRGFYDLGNNADYFFAKMRSHMAWMAAGIVQDAILTAPQKLVSSLADFASGMKNISQVLPNDFTDNQSNMNKLATDFIGIAAKYGQSVDEVIEAGRLWGRAYKDVNTIQALVHASTMLSITDNMSLTDTNKALEATMQQYGIKVKDQYEAQEKSMKIVDSWSKMADNAVVTAQDMATANEQSASAANQAGVSFDFLQGMIATMAANTGKSGAEVGRAIRSMLVSMRTDKAIAQIENFGVAMYKVNADGTKSFRSMEDVITDLMIKTQTTETDVNKLLSSISGGRQTCPPVWEHTGNKQFHIG